jgi:hypothetical protein
MQPGSVFVSSTWTDLQPHRQAVRNVVDRLTFRFIDMEEFLPAGASPAEYIRRRVEESEFYLAVVGMRYGSIDQASGFSMTELEYRQAVASNIERYIFLMDENTPIPVSMVEQSPDGLAKLLEFRRNLLAANVVRFFMTVDDLAALVDETLREHRRAKASVSRI